MNKDIEGLYYRKLWQWSCWDCRINWIERFEVTGKDIPSPKCERCGNNNVQGVYLGGSWAVIGCLSVTDEVGI